MKKIFAFVLLLVVVVSVMPIEAQAYDDVSFSTYTTYLTKKTYYTYAFDSDDTGKWVGGSYKTNGSYVKVAQGTVRHRGYSPGTVDGIYGTNTKTGIIAYQKAYSLTQDGIVGGRTWRSLFAGTRCQSISLDKYY